MIIRTESLSMSTGFPQIQRPFVQGIVVGPIANPVILLSNRLDRKDLPVRCGPAIEATAIYCNYNVRYFFILNAVEYLGSLLGELELILDSFALKPFLDHDKRDGLAIDLILDHFQKNIYKLIYNLAQYKPLFQEFHSSPWFIF
jgi:hypothetical protein